MPCLGIEHVMDTPISMRSADLPSRNAAPLSPVTQFMEESSGISVKRPARIALVLALAIHTCSDGKLAERQNRPLDLSRRFGFKLYDYIHTVPPNASALPAESSSSLRRTGSSGSHPP
jgi:hypothetical protein